MSVPFHRLSVHRKNLITLIQLRAFGCLPIRKDSLHKDAHAAFWRIFAADNGKPKRLLPFALLEDNTQEGEGRVAVWSLWAPRRCPKTRVVDVEARVEVFCAWSADGAAFCSHGTTGRGVLDGVALRWHLRGSM